MLGIAVTSHSTNLTRAAFQELGATVDPQLTEVTITSEPIGPSSRRTALIINEIMYHPADRADRKNLEFVEVYNSNPYNSNQSPHLRPAGMAIPARTRSSSSWPRPPRSQTKSFRWGTSTKNEPGPESAACEFSGATS